MVYTPTSDDEQVVALDLGISPNPGAPCPVLLQGGRTFLCFYTSPYVEASSTGGDIATIEWQLCRAAVLGPPNDEGIHGHRLWDKGMRALSLGPSRSDSMEVINSQWIASMERANRVHPSHRPARYADDRHFIVLFKDATFECVAQGYTVERRHDDMVTILRNLAGNVP